MAWAKVTAAAALTLPNFHEQMSRSLDAERVVVGVPGQTHMFVTAAASSRVEEIERSVREAQPNHGLVPSVWLLEGSGLTLISERG